MSTATCVRVRARVCEKVRMNSDLRDALSNTCDTHQPRARAHAQTHTHNAVTQMNTLTSSPQNRPPPPKKPLKVRVKAGAGLRLRVPGLFLRRLPADETLCALRRRRFLLFLGNPSLCRAEPSRAVPRRHFPLIKRPCLCRSAADTLRPVYTA